MAAGRRLVRRIGAVGALLIAPVAAAQTTALTVAVAGGGAPLAGARVSIGAERGLTGGDGRVTLSVPAGRVVVVAGAIGWRPDSVSVTVVGGRDTLVTLVLEAAPAGLEDLIVSVTRSSLRVEDEPLRVEVLDLEEIEEKQLMTPGDIVMMLNETGGVRVQAVNPSLGGAGIRIRGLGARYAQVLADGLPLFGERVGAFGPLQIPPLDLGRVEIVKGAASALFGGAALGGVINLVSRPPAAGSSALINATSLGGTDAVAYVAGGADRTLGHTLLLGAHTARRVDRDADGWADVPGYRRLVVRPRLFWRRGENYVVATGGVTVEDRDGGTLSGALAPDGNEFVERLETRRIDGGAAGRFRVGSNDWLAVRVSASHLGHRHEYGPEREPDRHRTAFAEASFSRRAAGLDFVAGAAATFDQFRPDRFPGFAFRRTTPAGFAQVERAGDRLGFSLSARLDDPDDLPAIVSPRLSLLWRPVSGWSVRAAVGAGFAAPTPVIDETERIGFFRVAAGPALAAERSVSGSLDLHGEIGPLELNASVFTARVRDPVQLRPISATAFGLVNAAEPTRASGADASLLFRRGSMAVTASYTFVRVTEADPSGSGRREAPLTPRHAAGLVAVYESEGGRIGLELYYTGTQALERTPGQSRSPATLMIGLLGERRLGPASVFLNAENLADVRQTRTAPLVLPVRAPDGSWTTDVWGPLDGRVVNLGLRWSWGREDASREP
ncbi:MAG: TonB-dependent receptor plug domain-containing protein [Gemmatimonadales bacterium]